MPTIDVTNICQYGSIYLLIASLQFQICKNEFSENSIQLKVLLLSILKGKELSTDFSEVSVQGLLFSRILI
jgi:hypothetical protein